MDANLVVIPNSESQKGLRPKVLGLIKSYVYKDIHNLKIILWSPELLKFQVNYSSSSSFSPPFKKK